MNTNYYREPSIFPNQNVNYGINDNYNKYDYVEYVLKENIGKKVKVNVSFADSTEWRNSVFIGVLKKAGKDYIEVFDENTSNSYLIWSIYIDYITFINNI